MEHICIVQDFLRMGGTETQSVHFANSLARAGYQVTLLSFCRGGILESKIDQSRVHYRSLRKKQGGAIWWAPRLVRTLRLLKVNKVILMGRNANHWGWWIKIHMPRVQLIATCRTGRSLWWPYRRSILVADRVMSNSRFLEDHLHRALAETLAIDVLYNACTRSWNLENISSERLRYRAENHVDASTRVFVNVQMFRPGKNKAELIHLFNRVSSSDNWQLWLVGDGVERPQCEELVNQYKLSHKIRFFDTVDDPFAFYCAADAIVSTSTEESLPNQFVEAQIVGRYIICYDVAGSRECFIDRETGISHPLGMQDHFVHSVETAIAFDQAALDTIEKKARIFAQSRFSQEGQTDRLIEILG